MTEILGEEIPQPKDAETAIADLVGAIMNPSRSASQEELLRLRFKHFYEMARQAR